MRCLVDDFDLPGESTCPLYGGKMTHRLADDEYKGGPGSKSDT